MLKLATGTCCIQRSDCSALATSRRILDRCCSSSKPYNRVCQGPVQCSIDRRSLALPAIVGNGLLPFVSRADEVVKTNTPSAISLAESTAIRSVDVDSGSIPPSVQEAAVTVVFTAAAAALGLITLGVLYLSLVTFFDQRKETEDREKFTGPDKGSFKGKSSDRSESKEDRSKALPKKQSVPLSRGGGKGFGR